MSFYKGSVQINRRDIPIILWCKLCCKVKGELCDFWNAYETFKQTGSPVATHSSGWARRQPGQSHKSSAPVEKQTDQLFYHVVYVFIQLSYMKETLQSG